ncbi:MAG TPA: GspH/FimT family pseudopilin [Burkholderiaceae bacterium]|jgi:type IV fimbrial biogenesis protein FimT|nr:GspH/FimT family pseudopilin [Burkholderiaceae bacterium]
MKIIRRFQPDPTHAVKAQQRNAAGFTLIELMVTVSIVAILAVIAGPSLSSLIATQRIKAVAADLYVALSKARSEALKRNVNVKLQPKTANTWEAGWEIRDPSDNTKKLEDHAAVKGATIVGPADLTYRVSGRITAATAPTFDITASGTTIHWCVTIDPSGRPYQKSTAC